ncbi:hypothetical protein EV663_10877 [Rhodovulum bhavnagarense]|uniref:Uncharacterized protein n=1 Tax=Rhodovulum bhavnagarense TaxID=992286 RepID=A0A4R2REB0_9RHOB|nr:hypothetical protein [Rhodovulum bhavnagarense]TCP60718.1 hypothetical protein EV663_10877 [Rhodovulum bhavnagarense]
MKDTAPGALHLTATRLRAGVWEGVLNAGAEGEMPKIEILHQETPLEGVVLAPDPEMPGRYSLAVPIPAALLSDGVQTFLVCDAATGATLDSFAIVTGAPLEQDLRAEIDLLRAELDMLKKAFRRHCVETM